MAETKNKSFPFEIQDLDPETNAELSEQFEDEFDGFVRVGPKGYFYPKVYEGEAAGLYNLQTGPDHLFVGGYPRSGTTWTQQIVWLIMHNLDYARCDSIPMEQKFQSLDIRAFMQQNTMARHSQKSTMSDEQKKDLFNYLTRPLEDKIQSHLFFKTHLPLSLLPPTFLDTSKMVYVARDPRDAIVSYYYFNKSGFRVFKRDFKTMWNNFLKGRMLFCPYFEHVKEAWEKRHNPNLLFLFYEDILNDRLNTLHRVASFCNKTYSDEQLLELCKYLDFDNLKDKKSFNYDIMRKHGIMKPEAEPFVRKGKVGDWREHFDEEMTREADRWIADNLRDTDLRFPTISLK